ncbi:hypothetical protein OH77DRAFT_1022856 [Trametes cingulata]|nr:hypothetical protein OH77DRAFT_1022856 [Trametes cingulata]
MLVRSSVSAMTHCGRPSRLRLVYIHVRPLFRARVSALARQCGLITSHHVSFARIPEHSERPGQRSYHPRDLLHVKDFDPWTAWLTLASFAAIGRYLSSRLRPASTDRPKGPPYRQPMINLEPQPTSAPGLPDLGAPHAFSCLHPTVRAHICGMTMRLGPHVPGAGRST